MNDDIGLADKDAKDIHHVLSTIAPLFELAPSLQSGLEKTARAAEISHTDVLGPIHNVTNNVVTVARLREIEALIDSKVIPTIAKFEKGASDAHLRAVTLTKDYIEACHIAATIQSATCIQSGNKAIDSVYSGFRTPIQTTNTVVIDAAKAISDLNHIMETEITVALKPFLDIRGPMSEIAKAMRAVEREIRALERDLRKRIHIHVGPVNVKFTVGHLLHEWKIEVRRFEHLLHVDKLKAAMRRAVERVVRHVVHAMEKMIHRLERNVRIDGFDLHSLEVAFKKFELALDIKGIDFGLGSYDLAMKEMSLGLHGLQTCK